MKSLDSLSEEINKLNQELVILLDKHLKVVQEIEIVKRQINLPIFDTQREQDILKKISESSQFPEQTKEIFQKIMEQSRKVQE